MVETMFSDSNGMMLELFRSEVESHSESLTSGLLALEQSPAEIASLEQMMRAAHSIKGAARIVRVDAAADVAHAMEDCFVAAQQGSVAFLPGDIDVLLRGVDLLVRIAAATRETQPDWSSFQTDVQLIVDGMQGILNPPAIPAHDAVPTRGQQSTRTIVRCGPLLNATSAEQARRELVSAIAAGATLVELDLSETTDLDAIGLAFLAAAVPYTAANFCRIQCTPVSAEIAPILHLTGLAAALSGAPHS